MSVSIWHVLRKAKVTCDLVAARRLWKRNSYLRRVGWFESYYRRMPVDRDGRPIPWFTYSATAFIEPRLRPTMRVFEYGSGNSTLWWSRHVGRVVSCESQRDWYERLRGQLPAGVEYLHVPLEPPGQYSRTILNYPAQFDIILIDGKERVDCARNCLGALTDDGVVLWDNSDLPDYRDGYDVLHEHGFKRLDLTGQGPISGQGWMTSVFYRPRNCFEI